MAIDRGGVVTGLAALALLGVLGGLAYQAQKGRPSRRPHNHAHATTDRRLGGHNHVVSLGDDEYHVEVASADNFASNNAASGAFSGSNNAHTGGAAKAT